MARQSHSYERCGRSLVAFSLACPLYGLALLSGAEDGAEDDSGSGVVLVGQGSWNVS